jgi:hypothetical protein
LLIRMRPEVQVLPGPLPVTTSENLVPGTLEPVRKPSTGRHLITGITS